MIEMKLLSALMLLHSTLNTFQPEEEIPSLLEILNPNSFIHIDINPWAKKEVGYFLNSKSEHEVRLVFLILSDISSILWLFWRKYNLLQFSQICQIMFKYHCCWAKTLHFQKGLTLQELRIMTSFSD